MKTRQALAPLLCGASILFFNAACSQKPARLTRVAVIGESNVKAQPDTAVIILSVVTQNQKALNAQQENARKSEAVMKAVKETAGANPEIKTSDYSLQPQNDYRDDRLPKIIGYEASNTVTVTMSELNNVGAVIDAASIAGANSVEKVAFILRENNPARGQTLNDATRQAMTKAQAIAQALGGRVVRVVEEQEGGTTRRVSTTESELDEMQDKSFSNANMSVTDARRSRVSTPVEAGSLNVRSQVQLLVEIEAQP
jgi:uncharacterized protein YggE